VSGLKLKRDAAFVRYMFRVERALSENLCININALLIKPPTMHKALVAKCPKLAIIFMPV